MTVARCWFLVAGSSEEDAGYRIGKPTNQIFRNPESGIQDLSFPTRNEQRETRNRQQRISSTEQRGARNEETWNAF
jgi:hypothetical protein